MVKVDFDLSGVKIPKQVAGVKVPKKLRKKGKKLLAKAQSAEGRQAIAAGLTIAGAAIAAGARAKAAKRAQRDGAAEEPHGAHRPVPPVPPRAPGQPGIDPNKDFGEVLAAGIGALQTFLAGKAGAK